MEVTSSRRKVFTKEKKHLNIKEDYSQGISIPVLARKYGVHAITLYSWKRQMNHKKNDSPISPEYIQKLIEENDKLKGEVQTLKAKVGDLTIKNDIMVNRQRAVEGRNKRNRKRVQRIIRMNGLSLPQTMPQQKRPHTGVIMTMFPNLRWCSDGMEIRCFNGDKVFVAFALDCCEREALAYVARTEPLSADDIEELMVKAVEVRFGDSLRCPREIQWLSDRGSIYRAKSVKDLGRALNLQCCYTRAYSPESNGMAEAFVKTIKRDYVYQADCDSVETVLKLLPQWFADYNNVARHSALGMKSPAEFKESVNF